MISIQNAITIAEKELTEYPVNEVLDLANNWGVCFDSGNPPIPGVPVITVHKQTGNIGFLTVPPIENLDIIETADVVWNTQKQGDLYGNWFIEEG